MSAEVTLRLKEIARKKKELTERTGHVLLEPANQLCKLCGEPMFVRKCSEKPCKEVG